MRDGGSSSKAAGGGRTRHRTPAGRENALATSQQQPRPSPLSRHAAALYDTALLHSFNAAVSAAGDSGTCWLGDSDDDELGAGPHLPSPSHSAATSAPHRASPAAVGAGTRGRPGSPSGTALLLPHLQSPEATSWLTGPSGGSPTHR